MNKPEQEIVPAYFYTISVNNKSYPVWDSFLLFTL